MYTEASKIYKIIKINPQIYPIETILSSCYSFTDRAYIFIDGNPKKEIFVRIKNKGRYSKNRLNSLSSDFQNSLIHYALREKISKYNKKIREYIICRALYSALPEFTDTDQTLPYRSGFPVALNRKKIGKRKR